MNKMCYRAIVGLVSLIGVVCVSAAELKQGFNSPSDSVRPGVYWYFMDGNMDPELMKEDLDSMFEAGLRKALFLEVNIRVPRGPVDFMSEPWQDHVAGAIKHADKLGMEIVMGTGPGWAGSGGPWMKPEQSMQHLCSSSVEINKPGPTKMKLPVPEPIRGGPMSKLTDPWHDDVAVLAFPTPAPTAPLDLLDVKALRNTSPYSSWKGVPRFVVSEAEYPEPAAESVIRTDSIIDLTNKMQPDGSLEWDVPSGNWTVMRFASRSTGRCSSPAPRPGLGLESNTFDHKAFEFHFENYHQKLMDKIGKRRPNRGLTALHLDSWEQSCQNWTQKFREAFIKQCGYDPQPFYPAYQGLMVGSRKETERFLFDMRRVAQELLLTEYAQGIKDTAHKNGLYYTSQGYDMNPAGDLDILSIADIPSCEFWLAHRKDTVFSCVEATSAAHIMGKPVVRAEAFTSGGGVYGISPGDMKDQSNWAFAMGINEFMFHTFQHQPLGKDGPRPGMMMGHHGVAWHRNQTFWPLVGAYHDYLSRCGQLLRQGVSVSDVLYLTGEGAPHIFYAPDGALNATQDKPGYGFDAISPRLLMQHAKVKDGKISFDNASSYRLMVLPKIETMTPKLLEKITELVKAGASIQGLPPVASPSLIGYPESDDRVKELAEALWGKTAEPVRQGGKGRVFRYEFEVKQKPEQRTKKSLDGEKKALEKIMKLSAGTKKEQQLAQHKMKYGTTQATVHPPYELTAALLEQDGVPQVFESDGNLRYHKRRSADRDLFFVANRDAESSKCTGVFRTDGSKPELWNPTKGNVKALPAFTKEKNGTVRVPLEFASHEGYFVVFDRKAKTEKGVGENFPSLNPALAIEGTWQVNFDPTWGGPEEPVPFTRLIDWATDERSGIKYYSGIADYEIRFDTGAAKLDDDMFLDLGKVEDVARVTLNGKTLGTVWSEPYRVQIPAGLLKATGNQLKIELANVWQNRLQGDLEPKDQDARTLQWENGMLEGTPYKTGRYTFSTMKIHKGALSPSGLLGPVQILTEGVGKGARKIGQPAQKQINEPRRPSTIQKQKTESPVKPTAQSGEPEMRRWAAGHDKEATGAFVRMFVNPKGKTMVVLRAPDGKEFEIGSRTLTNEDRAYLESIPSETK